VLAVATPEIYLSHKEYKIRRHVISDAIIIVCNGGGGRRNKRLLFLLLLCHLHCNITTMEAAGAVGAVTKNNILCYSACCLHCNIGIISFVMGGGIIYITMEP
jgi:hypothetical protein